MKCTSDTPTGKCGRIWKKVKNAAGAHRLGGQFQGIAAGCSRGGVAEQDLGAGDDPGFDMHFGPFRRPPDGAVEVARAAGLLACGSLR
jgi:hypothetical protein